MAIKRRPRSVRRQVPSDEAAARVKISVTVERAALSAIQAVTDNVSGFVNDAIKRKLYFQRLDAELELLDAEGVRPNAAGVRWLTEKIEATDRRLARRKRTRKSPS